MKQGFNQIIQTFQKNVDSVYNLMKFDEIIQAFCITALQRVNKFLEKHDLSNHPSCSVQKELQQIEKIRSHKSLRPHYQIMLNQCVVLLVSYFASAVEDLFVDALSFTLKRGGSEKLNKEELKLTIDELQAMNFNLSDNIGELIATKKDISFQDMKNIARAFKSYLGFEPHKDKNVNNIILAQACRHAIVHSGGVVKDRIIKQVSHATPRQVKQDLSLNQRLSFTTDEIRTIGASMTNYLDNLIQGLNKNL